jgi:hypothetical protein
MRVKHAGMTAVVTLLLSSLCGSVAAHTVERRDNHPASTTTNVEVEPITCWWRTSVSGVRVGEPFVLRLTCSVLETGSATVVADQSRLDPSVLQLPPFEVLSGTAANDFRTTSRRFFQYEYTLQLINQDVFGKDVNLPPTSINYRIQSHVDSIESRDRQYVLPTQSIRVLSLVPSTATDIRDRSVESFQGIEALRFRATAFRAIAMGSFAVGASLIVVALVLATRRRTTGPTAATASGVSDRAILKAVGRELADVRSAREGEGWSPTCAARALVALRVVAAYALSQQVSQTTVLSGAIKRLSGQLLVTDGWLRRRFVVVSSSFTSDSLDHERSQPEEKAESRGDGLSSLHTALTRFAAAAYGRDHAPGAADLDESLLEGLEWLRRLMREKNLIVRKYRASVESVSQVGTRLWSR